MKTLLLISFFLLSSDQTYALDINLLSPVKYIRENNITDYDFETNKEITKETNRYFSARVFKSLILKNNANKDLRNLVRDLMDHKLILNKKLENTILVINMGLGWDDQNFKNQAVYVQNFITEIKLLGLETHFLERDAYGPLELNIETIKPQLRGLFRSHKKILFLSLCKGSPELLVSLAEVVEEKPELKKPTLY